MCVKASSSHDNEVEFDIGHTTLIVAEQENLTATHSGATPVDSLTPAGAYVQLAI